MAYALGPSNHRRKKFKDFTSSSFSSYTISAICVLSVILNCCFVDCLKNCAGCDQGRCINDTCVCLPGWRGSLCDECYGRVSLEPGKEGVIHDGAANYSKDLSCSWLLDTNEDKGMRIRFIINEFATECVWDHLYIHDGDSAFAPLIAAYSGILWSSPGTKTMKVKLSGRYAFIHFYSDAAFTLPGFNISYYIDDCDLQCSDNAVCTKGVCSCESSWTGANCDVLIQGCLFNCSNHGDCVQGACSCHNGYRGKYCNVASTSLFVEVMDSPSFDIGGRASFSMVAENADTLWVLGGYQMGDQQKTKNMLRYSISSSGEKWKIIQQTGTNPWPRYGHSAVYYQHSLYLYGGVSGTQVMKDFWKYDIAANNWTELTSGPRTLSGHTSHIVNNTLILIFGYSSDYGYSNKVLEYNFVTESWTVVESSSNPIMGGYGHTSVYDVQRQKIYVYGGYNSQSASSYNLTDKLYQYDPNTREWFVLLSSGSASYLHAGAMINGLMLIFGGNTHNDTRLGRQAKCFASDFMVYDIDCNSWHKVKSVPVEMHIDSLDRFGHSMISVNNDIYMFGGFNSLVKSDMFKISSGICQDFENQSSCETYIPGIKCMWDWDAESCVTDDGTTTRCDQPQDPNASCSGYLSCDSCQDSFSSVCRWCDESKCVTDNLQGTNCSSAYTNCTGDIGKNCGIYHSCKSCQDNEECKWESSTCKALDTASDKTKRNCSQKICSKQHSCDDCTSANCMWCSNLAQCIETNSYVVSFHYGQCMDWTTKQGSCQGNNCSQMRTCAECQARPECGWCNDESGTGTGSCFDGGMTGPIIIKAGKPEKNDSCPLKRWFFNDCPKCQCNGHSICLNDSGICESCKNNTIGPHCETCADQFYGNPQNGGKCKPCMCNGQADSCNPHTGDCYCRTRGVTGRTCDRCDDNNKYSGDPKNGGICYYQLNTDFQYTFNLSKKEDKNYTQINFLNTPTSSDRDVDFTLNCSTPALINITYKSKSFPEEREVVTAKPCEYYRTKFEHKSHAFGGKENTTFLVYVYDFKTPFLLQISFVQPDKINLLKFFIIFFSCFLSLLLIAAALWKIKHKYDSYRRRQQLIVEMQQMASRPFSTINVETDRRSDPIVVDKKDHLDSVLRRRKKAVINKPSAIAIEPLVDNKAAILTLIIQLPTGDSNYAPSGQSGLAVGSALVSMGSNRKQSLEHIKGDRPKIRKTLSYNHPDTCA